MLELAEKHCEWLARLEPAIGLTVLGSMLMAMRDEVCRLREERDLFRTAGEAAELRIVELRAKLAQVDTVLSENRAPDGKWYVDAGILVLRIEAAIND
jgi:hypothetical protein